MTMRSRIKTPEIGDVIGALLICLAAVLTPLVLSLWIGH